jgi:hypothetical protein
VKSSVLPIPEHQDRPEVAPAARQMFTIDLEQGRMVDDGNQDTLSHSKPLQAVDRGAAHPARRRDWQDQGKRCEKRICTEQLSLLDRQRMTTRTSVYTFANGLNGEEATSSMGNDSPLAVLSNKSLYNYAKRLFALLNRHRPDPRSHRDVAGGSFVG